MQARMMEMFRQATSEGFGMSVSVGTLMLHGALQKKWSREEHNHDKDDWAGYAAIHSDNWCRQRHGGYNPRFWQQVSARTIVVIREIMKIGSNNDMEKMMQMLVQATQLLMTKMSGRRSLKDIVGKSGGKRGTEKIGGNRRKRGMAKIGGQGVWADWWQERRDQWQGQRWS